LLGGATGRGVTGLELAEADEVPAELDAVRLNVTGCPSLRPGTIAQSLGTSAVICCPVEAVTVNDFTGAPSTVAGLPQRTVAEEEPGTAVTPVGACVTGALAEALTGASTATANVADAHSAAM
jgi:hypothetical protein